MDKQGDACSLTDVACTLAHNAFSGAGNLLEGIRGTPDRFAFELRFDNLYIGALAAGVNPGTGGFDVLPVVEGKPLTLVDAQINVAGARFGAALLSNISLRAHLEAGRVTLEDSSLLIAGGKANLRAFAEPAANGTHIVGAMPTSA